MPQTTKSEKPIIVVGDLRSRACPFDIGIRQLEHLANVYRELGFEV